MKSLLSIALAFVMCSPAFSQAPEGWALFAKTKFEAKYNDKTAEYFLYPAFPADLKALVREALG